MATIHEKSKLMRSELVETIVGLMEQKGLRWAREWDPLMFCPRNGITNTHYRGVNRLNLACRALKEGFSDPRWATAHQAMREGWKIKAGSKASIVEKWGTFGASREEEEKGEEDIAKAGSRPRLQKIFHVFNYSQLIGPKPYSLAGDEMADFEAASRLLASSCCEVVETASSSAFYQLSADRIVMPHRMSFATGTGFAQVLAHELAHATGHKSRLDRESRLRSSVTTPEYAAEELRAEFSAVFVCSYLGIGYEGSGLRNHAAYLRSWLLEVKRDQKVMLDAISDAERIADYLIDLIEGAEQAPSHQVA